MISFQNTVQSTISALDLMNIRCITVDVLQSLVQGSLTVSGAASCARTPAFLSVASWWSAMKRDRIRFVDCIVSWNFSLSHILFEKTYVAGSKRSCLQNDIQFKCHTWGIVWVLLTWFRRLVPRKHWGAEDFDGGIWSAWSTFSRTCTPLRWRLDCQLVGRSSSTQFGEDPLMISMR